MSANYRMGAFELRAHERRLTAHGAPQVLGARAFDLLVVLVRHRDRLLSKDELMALVWPGVVVEENNLTVQVSSLRKVLGADAIATVAGRGYRFMLPVSETQVSETEVADKPSIAVLPFDNLSGDAEQEFFTDGVTEDIVTELSRFRELFVVARNSSFSYKGRSMDLHALALELGVRYVLEGSIRRSGDRIRVSANLVDASSGQSLWAERYDRVLQDVFEVQEEVTRAIVAAVAPHIDLSERTRAGRPGQLAAYDLAMRARAFALEAMYQSRPDAPAMAIGLSRQALALDARCSPALATLSFALTWQAYAGMVDAPVAALEEALDAARRLLAIDSVDPVGYLRQGVALCMLDRVPEGLRSMRRALELNPNGAETRAYLGMYEASMDGAVGTRHALESLKLSPRDPGRHLFLNILAWAQVAAGDYAAAAESAARAVGEAPSFSSAHLCLTVCAAARGDMPAARLHLAQTRRLSPTLVEARLAGRWMVPSAMYVPRCMELLRSVARLEGADPLAPPQSLKS